MTTGLAALWINGAVTVAAVAVAALLFVVCSALIRDLINLRQRARLLLQRLRAAEATLSDLQAERLAFDVALAGSGCAAATIDARGLVHAANAPFEDFCARHGLDPGRFDTAGAGRCGQPMRLRQGIITQTCDTSTVRWSLAAFRSRNGEQGFAVVGERQDAVQDTSSKARFLATVSHEMRTPLNGVIGMAGLLSHTSLTAEQASYVDAVRTSGEALLSLINEILDFSRIEAGKLDLAAEPVDLTRLVEGAVELLAPRAQDKGIEVAALIDPALPQHIMGDGARLGQILMNLAGNAVKFTSQGGVGIRVEQDGPDRLLITVADTGPGIAAERLTAIFDAFEQEAADTARSHGGTGLGLAITRRIVETMGGAISVVSQPGSGSAFRVALPLVPAERGPAVSGPVPDLSPESVLIVSSSPFEAPFLAERLQRLGARVRLAEAADARLMAGVTILLADADLGTETCQRLAQLASDGARRIVLLSPYQRRGFGSPADAGFDGYLIKPVRHRSLNARFMPEADENDVVPTSGVARQSVNHALAGQRILLAEDNPINALLAIRLMERLGITPLWVTSGEAALDALRTCGDQPFSAALFDVRMPGMSGLDAVAALRKEERASGRPPLPVAALTANAFEEDRAACLAAGFTVFLRKPLDPDRFAATLAELAAGERRAA